MSSLYEIKKKNKKNKNTPRHAAIRKKQQSNQCVYFVSQTLETPSISVPKRLLPENSLIDYYTFLSVDSLCSLLL